MDDTGLVLEGGGMRGVYTAGVLEVFMEQDLYLPYVIGVSAGACFGASYLSRQRGRNRKVNIDYVTHPKYLSLQNYIKHRQLFGMDFIFDEIPNLLVPFDYDTFYKCTEEFVITATDCQTGQPVYFNKKDYGKDMLTVIRASSSLPFIAPVVEYKGKHLLDGGITDSIPIKKAEEDGNKRNIIVLTREESYFKKKSNIRWLMNKSYRQYPKLIEAILTRYKMYNETLEHIKEQEKEGKIFVIRPSSKLKVGRIERNQTKLENLYMMGMEDAKREFKRLETWLKTSN
ncbi:patatin-like phospholipase family protein [Metabacillus halosaccharovorans]|uniref:patatin-like phospholipase family protein n=1 Tax=Metabacillus halosaccharovorans TaxID=930124 RepID=UPI00203D1286|nr:patatin family protein [Metabacillus halosaccharovorans]MCM3441720.1 patatin family protein [Metabacillus halosaccharovorans]